MKNRPAHPQQLHRRVAQVLLAALSFQAQVHAADIANVPLATQSTAAVRANLMFIMDDSLSMGWDYLPDAAGNYNNLCFGYQGTNGVFYDPTVTYLPPLRADGTAYPDQSFTAARSNGFNSGSSQTNLSQLSNLTTPSTRVGGSNQNPVNSRFYYATYSANNPATPACSGNGYDWSKWTIVTSLPAAQQTNYANWYSYYRTRMLTMRSAVGRAMSSIDGSRFRVGYSAISSNSYVDSTGFIPVRDFDAGTQKADFYAKLYSAPATGYTPLRPALEKIGKYYAGRQRNGQALPNGAVDPLQYSCQRNYALLTTDGFWNRSDEPNNYTPTRLDGSTAIGNPDGGSAVSRPRRDDGQTQGNNWVTGGPGVANTLADISMYFFQTDLRDPAVTGTSCTGAIAGQNVCTNNVGTENVPFVGTEDVKHQRMTTYSLGLGIAGQLTYRPDYETATSGSYAQLKDGSLAWPNPDPGNNGNSVITRADDLWHTAVNGRGRYYSASKPADLVSGLSNALDTISAELGTGAAGATSSQKPVAGDNFAYVAEYKTVLWEGNLKALTIDTTSGQFSVTPQWEAKNTLAAQVSATSDARTIYFRDPSVTTTQRAVFNYTNLSNAGHGAGFANLCANGNFRLSQCATLAAQGAAVQSAANDGANVVDYLRGRTGLEDRVGNATTSRLFRARPNTPLGDVVSAAPVYVKKPPFKYVDAGYNTFAGANANRTGVVYVAANDGMLHAFDAVTGVELWAYVPTAVLPNLWRLADANYDINHRYYVDATPVVGDVFDGTNWRTILIGGLGAGGRAYYALDITNPANPISLWEFSSTTDNDLGLTFGNPVITKNSVGTWVVAFSSGYSNTAPGNGNGYLFVRDALTGASIDKIGTFTAPGVPAGTASVPSELGRINAWIDAESNNTATRFYAGDMLGNMWRFDHDNTIAPSGKEAMLLGRAQAPNGSAQPITTIPILTKIGGVASLPSVTFATGRYLGATDLGDTTVQSIYVVKETLGASGLGVLRSNPSMVQQTLVGVTVNNVETRRLSTPQPVDWGSNLGWFVDLSLSSGERVNVDMIQTSRLLAVASNVPSPSACNTGGTSWLYNFDITSGVVTDALYYDTLSAGMNIYKTGDTIRITVSDVKGRRTTTTPVMPGGPGASLRRSSWRELVF
jgi:type IV pilus assembly protein PilY1